MCGIFGITKQATFHEINVDHIGQTLRHRGPDHHGVYEDAQIHMSHLLLAIRGDVTESVQPVHTVTSPWVLAFNGQLYNTKEIKHILGSSTPQTTVDTQLLYALIQKVGWGFIEHIHGMFAIALYNKEEHVLKLYRDQSGQKNLYYTKTQQGFVFSSEIRGLLTQKEVQRKINPLGIALATSIGYIPGKETLIKDVYKLNPSEELTFTLNTQSLSSRIFSSLGQNYYGEYAPEKVMQMVIGEHLQSNREISINLSGGLDSSLIFHEAVRLGHTLQSFSTRFEVSSDTYNTDATLAQKLSHDYGQTFVPINITQASYLEHFVESYKMIEEPNFNISVPIYYQTAKTEGINGEGLRVVLSGDGGDEVFGGYPHYAFAQRMQGYKELLSPFIVNLYKRFRDKRAIDYRSIPDIFFALRSFRTRWDTTHIEDAAIQEYLREATKELCMSYSKNTSDMYELMLLDRFVWLASENFIRSDKLYMSQSMEMRCPLAYTPLRTYMDAHIKKTEYISPLKNKIFLRELYEGKLPNYITHRKDKTGWRAPVQHWYNKAYKNLFLEILGDMRGIESYLDWDHVHAFVESKDTWPGKTIHVYLSLAILIREFNLTE